MDGQARAGSIVMYAVGLVVLTASTTAVFLAMRDVMAVGGSCASGGPYEVAVPCPEGTGLLIGGGMVGWFVGAGVALVAGSNLPGSYANVAALAWPALFLSMGWNFLDFGLDPADGGGTNGGMVFCGVLFFLMGGLPLVFGIKGFARGLWPRTTEPAPVSASSRLADPLRLTARAGRPVVPAPTGGSPASRPLSGGVSGGSDPLGAGLVGELERLAELRASGALDEDEYERAKDLLLSRSGEDGR